MGVYLRVAGYAFRRYSTYRVATASAVVTNTVFGFLRAYILIALWQARPQLGGYDVADAVAFSFLTQALIGPVNVFAGSLELTGRIRTGDVAVDLHRPVDLQGWWLADDLGRAVFALVFRGVPTLAAGMVAFGIPLPGPATLAAFLGSAALAVLVGFALRYLVSLCCFWLGDERGLHTVSTVSTMFFSGMILPLVVFPGPLGEVARALPWAALIQVPADVFLGRHTGTGLLGVYAFQAAWAVALLGAGRALTRAARHRLMIHGG
ncbi:ABC transporter permease [Actinomadura craniellae]|uniref:ABC transporter permease n=1 Tax=Actinomadura craniellae TaxID=2231787 RepID=A0A365GZ23_9ACTN|nr:ABC-2 family transporter protein [Actinomadura craniellae]RAY11183.1 ABC transporter permease [Actinomadura craniellae]